MALCQDIILPNVVINQMKNVLVFAMAIEVKDSFNTIVQQRRPY